MGERADNRDEENDQDAVNRPEASHRSALAQFTNAKGRKHIVHLHEDQFEKCDQNQEGQQPIKSDLS